VIQIMKTQDHLYTVDPDERDVAIANGFVAERAEAFAFMYSVSAGPGGGSLTWRGPGIPGVVPLYRLFHSGVSSHLYTASLQEHESLAANGWRPEGVAAYVAAGPLTFQDNWRRCAKCRGLHHGGLPGACPAGGMHDHGTSRDYVLLMGPVAAAENAQNRWRWCRKCQGLAFVPPVKSPILTAGRCPAGSRHDHSASVDYTLAFEQPGGLGQTGWRWCSKCQGLALARADNAPIKLVGACPAGSQHDHSASARYVVLDKAAHPNWSQPLVPLHRLVNPSVHDRAYVTRESEVQALQQQGGYQLEGQNPACFVYPVHAQPPSRTRAPGELAPVGEIVPLWRTVRVPAPEPKGGTSFADVLAIIAKGAILVGALFAAKMLGGSDCKYDRARQDENGTTFEFSCT
jgi:hypothetical protein